MPIKNQKKDSKHTDVCSTSIFTPGSEIFTLSLKIAHIRERLWALVFCDWKHIRTWKRANCSCRSLIICSFFIERQWANRSHSGCKLFAYIPHDKRATGAICSFSCANVLSLTKNECLPQITDERIPNPALSPTPSSLSCVYCAVQCTLYNYTAVTVNTVWTKLQNKI